MNEDEYHGIMQPIFEKLRSEGWSVYGQIEDYSIDQCYTIYFKSPRLLKEGSCFPPLFGGVDIYTHIKKRESIAYLKELSEYIDSEYHREKQKIMEQLSVLARDGKAVHGKITMEIPLYFGDSRDNT